MLTVRPVLLSSLVNVIRGAAVAGWPQTVNVSLAPLTPQPAICVLEATVKLKLPGGLSPTSAWLHCVMLPSFFPLTKALMRVPTGAAAPPTVAVPDSCIGASTGPKVYPRASVPVRPSGFAATTSTVAGVWAANILFALSGLVLLRQMAVGGVTGAQFGAIAGRLNFQAVAPRLR